MNFLSRLFINWMSYLWLFIWLCFRKDSSNKNLCFYFQFPKKFEEDWKIIDEFYKSMLGHGVPHWHVIELPGWCSCLLIKVRVWFLNFMSGSWQQDYNRWIFYSYFFPIFYYCSTVFCKMHFDWKNRSRENWSS